MVKRNRGEKRRRREYAIQRALSGDPGTFNWVAKMQQQKLRKGLREKHKKEKPYSGKRGAGYSSRNGYLKNMGFASYAAYLRSDLWRAIRGRVFAEKGRDCFTCGESADIPHHLRYHYDDLKGETLEYIVPVCNRCHRGFEFVAGVKVSLADAKSAYEKKRQEFLTGK